ncbi:MAG: class I SAM-dependent methyltransferase [Anaerolineae bacterium]|nr:class I SAM-dependent methyltransferase [Anaerolineae bacterium]
MWYITLVQTGLIPDGLIRAVLRSTFSRTLRQKYRLGIEERSEAQRALLHKLRQSPIAIATDDPNRQHYEVPAEFFQLVLGKWLKYSCCYWPSGVTTLDAAEEAMLRLSCEHAGLEDGMEVLDLGCGWGSLSLWIATHYPNCRVMAVSNSATQRAYIEAQCRRRGIDTVEATTANVVHFESARQFDRVMSVEMFEHMKNYEQLMAKVASMLRPEGMLFVHVFSHREFAYEFDAEDPQDWMAQTFFTGGTMPSDDLLLYFQRDLRLVDHWRVGGTHYERTLNAWLTRLDQNRAAVKEVMVKTYGAQNAGLWLTNWRLFFLVCAEAWGLWGGREYLVSHYLFQKPGA